MEELEARTLLAVFTVTTTLDNGDNLHPIPGSLRDAINNVNRAPDAGPQTIKFALAANDPNHLYYKNDGKAGQVSLTDSRGTSLLGTTTVDDTQLTPAQIQGQISGIDPDYLHTWWRIQPLSLLPAVTKPTVIDGYSQAGASENTIPADGLVSGPTQTRVFGDNRVLRVELDGSLLNSSATSSVLRFDQTTGTVRGLAINRFVDPAARNTTAGILLVGNTNSVVAGNFLGLDISGTLAPNGTNQNSWRSVNEPTVHPIMNDGVIVQGGTGNLVGTNADGVGDPGERNVISAVNFGVVGYGPAGPMAVAGNFIGTDKTGTRALGDIAGVTFLGDVQTTIGRTGSGPFDAARRNLISGNYYGILFGGESVVTQPDLVSKIRVSGNWIGTDVTGQGPLGNNYGVSSNGSSSNQIGAGLSLVDPLAALTLGNVIAFNHGPAVIAADNGPFLSTGNFIRGNSIHDNWTDYRGTGGGAAIDLLGSVMVGTNYPIPFQPGGSSAPPAPYRPLVNDSRGHAGSNHFQNYPVLTAVTAGAGTTITFTFHSTPNRTFWFDFYANAAPGDLGSDGRYYGEGQTYLGGVRLSTDASGNLNTSATLPTSLPWGLLKQLHLSATATDTVTGDTSEFSPDFVVPAASAVPVTSQSLQALINTLPATGPRTVTLLATTADQANADVAAVNGLAPQTTPVTVVVALGPGVFPGLTASPRAGVTLILQGDGRTTTLGGHSPALTVLSGSVVASGLTFTNATDAPTILVQGGTLQVRHSVIEETTGGNQAAVALTGGTVDLGTAADPGDNLLNVNGPGELVRSAVPNAVSVAGNTFAVDGTVLAGPASTTPLAFPDAYQTFENTALTVTGPGLLANDLDPAGGLLTVIVVDGPAYGELTWNTDGSFIYQPAADFQGSDSFTYQARNSLGNLSAVTTVTLTVKDAPLSATGAAVVATAGAPFRGVVASFTDGDPLARPDLYTATVFWGDDDSSAAIVVNDGQGSFNVLGTHTYAAAGRYVLSVQILDQGGSSATVSSTATVANLGQRIRKGQVADADFWADEKGRALLNRFNGGAYSTALGDWLAATLPNLFGTGAADHDLTGKTNAEVAAFYRQLRHDRDARVEAEVLTTALNVYATTLSLGDTTARAYGFSVTAYGLGASSYNVGRDGAAIGVANRTTLNVYQILKAANNQAQDGVLDAGDPLLRRQARNLFAGINEGGDDK